MANFIGLMTALRREIIRSGAMANQMTVEAMRIVENLYETAMSTWKKENGMTNLAQISTPLLSASGQFKEGKLETHMLRDYSSGEWMEIWVRDSLITPYPATPVPVPFFFSLLFGSFYLMNATHTLCCTKLNSNKMPSSQIYC